ncbi:DNA mismatch repair protein MutS-like,N-terminal [Ostreococcus tauri]|uniref:DNA mismatch repair protein MutS-like,N-terminal n=1 Tax=Ostreococcus tauri TaxID=70448 RepID=Q01B29_OSTTA|nr:DNA mismatch repair protein MutS-like,N-terminal [Ostreococcus tauri]CAL51618.1 DNA mismatch repair protein MutS-like,N-terminal [Ostreococcus tauri]|eukprot:XP_003078738.1 DNA mismatch repair protein MutS-like,N-terminal [Ostreococcus tauri]
MPPRTPSQLATGQRTISSFFASTPSARASHATEVKERDVVDTARDDFKVARRARDDDDDESVSPNAKRRRDGGDIDSTEDAAVDVPDVRPACERNASGRSGAREAESTLERLKPSSPSTRARFVAKLSLDRRRRDLEPDKENGGGEGGKSGSAAQKMTPLELSVKAFKAKYPGTLLMIEVGYKFHFYGDDARDASKTLGIFAYQSRNYLTASVPVVRLNVYVRRLVKAGFRVGVVRQTETAALKASGESGSGNKSGLFERQLVGLYTKATLDAGAALSDAGDDGERPSGTQERLSNHLLCVAEERVGGSKVRIGLAAIETSTGDVLNGEFTDTMQRAELESRLLCISPAEIVIVEPISEQTTRLIKALYGSGADAARVEHLTRDTIESVELTGAKAEQASPLVHTALRAGAKYLSDFGQADILQLDAAFRPLEGVNEMKLSPNVLRQLEVLTSSAGAYKGSLLWLMNHTATAMGGRLLRHWVSHPLHSKVAIERRLDAVEALRDLTSFEEGDLDKRNHSTFNGLKMQLKQLPDLDRQLARVFHGTATPSEFVSALTSLSRFGEACGNMREGVEGDLTSTLLVELISAIADPSLRVLAETFMSALNLDVACVDKPSKTKIGLFKDDPERFPELSATVAAVNDAKQALADLLPELRKKLGIPRLEYTTVGGVGGGEWLIEVPMDKSCPVTWIKVSSNKSKKVVRYHPPEVTEAVAALERANERHMMSADAAWKEFLSSFRENYATFRAATSSIASLDALHALAIVARNDGYVRPELVDDTATPVLYFEEGRHPVLDAHLLDSFVPNGVDLAADRTRALVITGPNMGGKSCYIRQIALLSIMAQVGSFVPAKCARLTVLDAVYTRMGASDNLAMGSSTFLEEMSEASNILEACTPKSLVIMDELGRGTSTHDGVAIAAATLEHLVRDAKCFTLFVTHYPSVARDVEAKHAANCASCFTSYVELPGSSDDVPRIQFLYKITPGVAHRSFGLNVARMAGLPTEVIQSASVKASELEIAVARRALARRGTFDDVTAKTITDAATAALASITREHDLTTSRANALRALE